MLPFLFSVVGILLVALILFGPLVLSALAFARTRNIRDLNRRIALLEELLSRSGAVVLESVPIETPAVPMQAQPPIEAPAILSPVSRPAAAGSTEADRDRLGVVHRPQGARLGGGRFDRLRRCLFREVRCGEPMDRPPWDAADAGGHDGHRADRGRPAGTSPRLVHLFSDTDLSGRDPALPRGLWPFGFYHLLPREAGSVFLLLIVVESAIVAVLANAPALGLMAILGGLVTPLLLHSERDQYVSSFLYLMALDVGAVLIVTFRHSPANGNGRAPPWDAGSVLGMVRRELSPRKAKRGPCFPDGCVPAVSRRRCWLFSGSAVVRWGEDVGRWLINAALGSRRFTRCFRLITSRGWEPSRW